jgi:DNA-binding GntR family transcriptional regulator
MLRKAFALALLATGILTAETFADSDVIIRFAIVEAVCNGDSARAGELARKHIRGSRNNILRLLQAKSDYQSFVARAS